MQVWHGLGAYNTTYSHDDCSTTGLAFGANQNTSHTDASGKLVISDYSFVLWSSYNWCSYSWSVGYADGNLSMRGNSSKLTVSGLLSGWDYNSGPVTVDVTVTFDATGNYVERGENTDSFSTPWSSYHSHSVGTRADAAISGSITLRNSNLLPTSAITYTYGSLYTVNSGSVFLYYQ